mmetsp:Transcript_14389/g.37339  ORF Transcript_14389/g.37339 Transcript_14389/m.37339 type:complete len:200 (+) Transcript_14389:369-968(+)
MCALVDVSLGCHAHGKRVCSGEVLACVLARRFASVELLVRVLPHVIAHSLQQHGLRLLEGIRVSLAHILARIAVHRGRLVAPWLRALHQKVAHAHVQRELCIEVGKVAAVEHLDRHCILRQQRQMDHASPMRRPEDVGFADNLGLVGVSGLLKNGALDTVARLLEDRKCKVAQRSGTDMAAELPSPSVQLRILCAKRAR